MSSLNAAGSQVLQLLSQHDKTGLMTGFVLFGSAPMTEFQCAPAASLCAAFDEHQLEVD
jgi:hypothetical protein